MPYLKCRSGECISIELCIHLLLYYPCSPTSDGAAAAIVCNEDFIKRNPSVRSRCVEILGMEMATDLSSTFNESSCIKMVSRSYTYCNSRCVRVVVLYSCLVSTHNMLYIIWYVISALSLLLLSNMRCHKCWLHKMLKNYSLYLKATK